MMGKNRQSIGYKKEYWRFFHKLEKIENPTDFLKPVGFEILLTKNLRSNFQSFQKLICVYTSVLGMSLQIASKIKCHSGNRGFCCMVKNKNFFLGTFFLWYSL